MATGDSGKTAKIEIRCSPKTKTAFKLVAANFKDQEIAMLALINTYNQIQKTAVKGGVDYRRDG